MKKIIKLLAVFFIVLTIQKVHGQIISQYVETNSGSTPKGIEIWNNTASALDFSLNNLVIEKGTNGGAPSADYTISEGTLASGHVLVIGTSDMEAEAIGNGAVFYEKAFTFNGDDALVVKYGATTTDVFGNPGSDPGASWSGNGVSTANQNIELINGISDGDTDGWIDPSERFSTVSTNPSGAGGIEGFGIAPISGAVPIITVIPATLTGFEYLEGNGPSEIQTFAISGTNLTDNISIVPPINYEISILSGLNFTTTNPVTLVQVGGTVPQTNIYVRLKEGLNGGQYNNEIINSSSAGANDQTVSCSGTVLAPLTTALPYEETFDTDLSGVYTYAVSGIKPWYHTNASAAANAYQGSFPEEHWMMLPGINLNNYTNEVLSFTTYARFGTNDGDNYLKLFYSTDYSGLGDVSAANWTEITYTQPEGINNAAEVSAPSGNIDLSAINGNNVYFAFKYYSNGSPTLWRVDDIQIFENVVIPASQLAFVDFPASGSTGAVVANFTVEARRPDNTVDINYTEDITIAMAGRNGVLNGTLTKTAVSGVATFDDIYFSQAGDYTLTANSGALTPANSSQINVTDAPSLTEVLLPQYIANGASGNRIPYTFRAQLDNLLPNATYRYINQVVVATDGPTTSGAGNVIYVNSDGTITRQTVNPTFGTVGSYGEFTTDNSGSFTGWFMVEPTSNARFTAGNEVFMRIRLNDGNEGTSNETYLTTTSPVNVIVFGTTADATQGTGIIGLTAYSPNNMAFIYDNTAGNGRPLYGTSIETTGIDYADAGSYASFYLNNAVGTNGAWGGIIPNVNANGVKLLQERSLVDGTVVNSRTSNNGQWGIYSTINPTGGKDDIIIIDLTQAPSVTANPGSLEGFGYVEGNGPSTTQSFVITGNNLTSAVSVVGTAAFELSLSDAPNFNGTNLITLNSSGGILNQTTVYVRMKAGLNPGEYNNQEIYVASPGAETKTVLASGTVTEGINTPASHATDFAANALDFDRIALNWMNAVPAAAGYLIKGSAIAYEAIEAPVDGIAEANGALVRNVAAGSETYTFEGLSQLTDYFFKIFPYNGSGAEILYKTDGEVPQAMATTPAGPNMTTEILPMYFGASNARLPFAFRASFSGLLPNATYKYINQAVSATDGATSNGAGNPIYVLNDGSFIRSTSTNFNNPGQHAEFTTDAEGNYSGWFMMEPTTNARFAAGNEVFMRIRLNDGAGGTAIALRFTSDAVTMLGFGTDADATQGTAIRATSNFGDGNFVFLYGSDARTARPLAGTSIEATGIDFAAVSSYASFYRNDVSSIAGAFGTIVPNLNASGVTFIEERSNATGEIVATRSAASGTWGETNTVNPTGGLDNVLVLDLDQSPSIAVNPSSLDGFNYTFGEGPSTVQSFNVEGANLTGNVTLAAPASFEISLNDGAAFAAQPTIVLVHADGSLAPTTIYVRMKSGLDIGLFNESILATSAGATDKNLALSGEVEAPVLEPIVYPGTFAVVVNSMTQLTASWTDAPQAEGYVIKGSTAGFAGITAPIDGNPEADALLVKNVAAGVQTAVFDGLTPETTYYFSIYPYNGAANKINYKTDGVAPQGMATTQGEVAINSLILPKFIQGVNGTNNNRLPFAFRAAIINLKPNSTYKYINQAVSETDGETSGGAGNPIYVNGSAFFRSSNPGFVTDGQYGEFTTDASGNYTGWFMLEATGNNRFTPGNEVMMRIRLNDGAGGTAAETYLTTASVKVLNFSETNDAVSGTGIRAVSSASPRNFAFIYDNVNGAGRPLYGTSIETTGVDFAGNTSYPGFYRDDVAENIGAWGGIVPNMNNAGVRRVEERSLTNGIIVGSKTSDNGLWGFTSTINPDGGLTDIIVLDLTDGPELETVAGQVKFYNPLETPVPSPNNEGVFYVQLFENGVPVRPRQLVAHNNAMGLDSYYSFSNIDAERSYTLRIWEANQSNTLEAGYLWNNWGGVSSIDALLVNYMAVGNPVVSNFPWINGVDGTDFTAYSQQLADVNNSASVSALDALSLMNRVVGKPGSNPFPGNKHNFHVAGSMVADFGSMRYPAAPEVQFEAFGDFVGGNAANTVYYEAGIPAIQTGLNVFNIYFSPVGDMNASFVPQSSKQTALDIELMHTIPAEEGMIVEIPVYLNQTIELAAYNISMQYDANAVEVLNIRGASIAHHDAAAASIKAAWLGNSPATFNQDEPLFIIEALVKQIPAQAAIFQLEYSNTAFASAEATQLTGINLKTIGIQNSSFAQIRAAIMPNPFSAQAVLSLSLPESGTLSIRIYDQLGKLVAAQTKQADTGLETVQLDAESIGNSGIYHYSILLEGIQKQHLLNGKIVIKN